MEIAEKDFKLKPVDECSTFFDLELLYVVKPRGREPRLEFKNAGYGLSLESAIKKVAQYRVDCNHREEAIRLKEYFSEYKKEIDSLKELLCGS